MAAECGHVQIVKYLCSLPLERGVDPSARENDALIRACSAGGDKCFQIVKYLCSLPIERGVDPSAQHNESLKKACRWGNMDTFLYLTSLPAERGVDPAQVLHYMVDLRIQSKRRRME